MTWIFRVVFICIVLWSGGVAAVDQPETFADFKPVQAVPIKKEWNRFRIFVWPYKTDIPKDYDLYRQLGLQALQIDRGWEQGHKIHFAAENKIPYYAGHVADKGFLFLKGQDVQAVSGKRGLVKRPKSLADPLVLQAMKAHIRKNASALKAGPVVAYAFDDEISLGSRINPCDVDIHPLSLKGFRQWLSKSYGTINRLNAQWGSSFNRLEAVMPFGFEDVRRQLDERPVSGWNLSSWMDFRHYMDIQFARVLSELTRYTNRLDPQTPAGFVGGQGPGPWGGYDYALLTRAVQWMEAYDINGTNEILRSWWNPDRRLRMQTFFSSKNAKRDAWFFWYYLLHGCQGVVAWPEGWFQNGNGAIAPHIQALKDLFLEIQQGQAGEILVDPGTEFDPDPIGIYYSHPSIQAGWAMDALVHGRTWINRRGSIDNDNQSMGILRKVWCKTLEDLGFQYDFVSYLDVEEDRVDLDQRFKVIILPKIVAISDREAAALRQFVVNGGTLIADYLCGILDQHGRGRSKGALNDLFGVKRSESRGYMNGRGITEVDGEKYHRPFVERFTHYKNALRHQGMVVFERGLHPVGKANGIKQGRTFVQLENRHGKGRAVYLNLTPLAYWDHSNRFSEYGEAWRARISGLLTVSGLTPRVRIVEPGHGFAMIEPLFWKNGNRRFLGIVKNPTQKERMENQNLTDSVQAITGKTVVVELEFDHPVTLVNLRSGKRMAAGTKFRDLFNPWQGNFYEVLEEHAMVVP